MLYYLLFLTKDLKDNGEINAKYPEATKNLRKKCHRRASGRHSNKM